MTDGVPVADATQDDALIEQTDNGPEPGQPIPSQDPNWVPSE